METKLITLSESLGEVTHYKDKRRVAPDDITGARKIDSRGFVTSLYEGPGTRSEYVKNKYKNV